MSRFPARVLLPLLLLLGACADPTAGSGARPAAGAPVEVRTVVVRAEQVAQEIEALGTARAREAVDITAKVANTITAIRFREGQQVARGSILVELDGAEARADLESAEAALAESTSAFNRANDLAVRKIVSAAQLEQLDATRKSNQARVSAARARLADTVIRAPFAGRTGLRRVSVGSLISPGTVITTLDDTSTIRLDFTVPEAFLGIMQEGLAIAANTVAYPGRSFTGRVSSVDSRVDPASRAVTVRADIPNAEGLLKPGMFMTVTLRRAAEAQVIVPEQALVPELGKVFVFVVAADRVQRREITLGARRPGDVQVVSGLAAGERVIVEGTQKVRDGDSVRETAATAAAATTTP